MVAAAKLNGDKARLENGKVFGDAVSGALDAPASAADAEGDEKAAVDAPHRHLVVLLTSDRGLCGAVNTFCVKLTKKVIEDLQGEGHTVQLFLIGEKGRAQLRRLYSDLFVNSIDEGYANPMNFLQASAMTERVLAEKFDKCTLVHNEYKSVIAYDQVQKTFVNLAKEEEAVEGDAKPAVADGGDALPPHLQEYEFEPEMKSEVMKNLMEFNLAGSMYGGFLENLASEQSARMTAMDNATNNANDMIEKLSLKYNRARQARITTELIEIISGANAV